jgi:hydroxymethylglutaryl-CoA lyase
MFSALVPNEKGMQAALAVNELAGGKLIGKVSVFTAASEEFSRRNINASIAESIERFVRVVELAHGAGLLVRGYISCAFGCPFVGRVDPVEVGRVAEMLDQIGVDEFDVADTIGAARPDLDPDSVDDVLLAVTSRIRKRTEHEYAPHRVTLHFHDTLGLAARGVQRSLGFARSFDGSVAGLGGCPYASAPGKRAPGNISTELLVRTIHEAGYETGVDLDKLAVAAAYARSIVSKARMQAAGGGA